MTNASDLPTEIWLLIARHLPKSELFHLKSLNRLFFNCWMEMSWKQVEIDTEFPDRAIRSLLRLIDPFVAARTKSLRIRLWHFRLPEPATPSLSSIAKLKSRLLSKPKSRTTPPTFHTAVTLLLVSLPLLPSITSLKIELLHIPLSHLPSLFQTITNSTLAKTVQTLWLSGHVGMFALLGGYPVEQNKSEMSFGNLTELSLSVIPRKLLCNSESDEGAFDINATDITLGFARFMLSFSPSIQHLCLSNMSTTLDLSLLFSLLSQPSPNSPSLVPFPNLQSFFLILNNFDGPIQSSSESLRRFLLNRSNNLRHLRLNLKMKRAQIDRAIEHTLGTWLADFVNNLVHDFDTDPILKAASFFPNLQTLDIYPSTHPAGISALLTLLQRVSPTLSSLVIRDHYLSDEEARQVLDTLADGIEPQVQSPTSMIAIGGAKTRNEQAQQFENLRMNVIHLTVPFLDLMAQKLPGLQKLTLSVSEILGSEQRSFFHLIDSRCDGLLSTQDDYLSSWNLHDLSISQAGQKMDDVVRAVATVVPSVVVRGSDDED